MVSPHYDDAPRSLGQSMIDGELSRHRLTVGIVFGRSNWVQWFHPTRSRWPIATAIRTAEEGYNAVRFGYRVRIAGLEEALLRLDDTDPTRLLDASFDATTDPLAEQVATEITRWSGRADLVLGPLGIGNHIDHQLAAVATAGLLATGHEVGFYEDRPYAAGLDPDAIAEVAHRLDPRLVRRAVSGPMGSAKHRRIFYPSQFDDYFTDAIAEDERSGSPEYVWVLPESTFALA